jgi:DNA-binding NarL/FixJ family response regulator
MRAGVRGYLLLTTPVDELVRALRRIHTGDTVVDPGVAAKIADSFSGRALTLREIDVLGLVMVGLSDKAIAKRLMRSVGTVKSHMKSLLAKLDAASRTEAAAIARRRGLVADLELQLVLGRESEADFEETAGMRHEDMDHPLGAVG